MEEGRPELTGDIVDGRFRVEGRLGSGGMGTVWRVQHVVSLQRFAMKTIDAAYAGREEATQRFLREVRAAAALRTRHVVRMVDAQMHYRHNGQPLPFLVMELLEGGTLQALLDARGRLTTGELAWMAGQLGRALAAAHKLGIVHRDLKPSNVFVAEDDEGQPTVKLCDFGIAKLLGPSDDAGIDTRSGAVLGTPMYLAPELLRGAGAAVPATDQWSLGLIAFRALAGAEYFGHVKGFTDLVLTIANDPLVPPSQRVPGLPPGFDAWFLRSCAREPAGRFADVPAQVEALEEALGRPASCPIPPPAASGADAFAETASTTSDRGSPPPAAPLATRLQRAKSPARPVFVASAVIWALGALALVWWLGGRARGPAAVPAPVAVTAPVRAPSPPPAPAPAPAPATAPVAAPLGEQPGPASAGIRAASPDQQPAVAEPLPPATKPHHRTHRTATARTETARTTAMPHAAAPAAAPPTAAPARGLPKGATCRRSAECASGLCAAETCL
jgi:serine/threonine-protein kinase